MEHPLPTSGSVSVNGIKEGSNLCSRCRTAERRRKGRYCPACHAAFNRSNRLKLRESRARLEAAWHNLTICNADTKQKFEKTIGVIYVVVVKPGGDKIDFAGTVTGYLPAEKLSVIDEAGKLVTVDLALVRPDKRILYE